MNALQVPHYFLLPVKRGEGARRADEGQACVLECPAPGASRHPLPAMRGEGKEETISRYLSRIDSWPMVRIGDST
jgi:hypothetical protein